MWCLGLYSHHGHEKFTFELKFLFSDQRICTDSNKVVTYLHIKGWITLGNKNRATAATGMNDKSSRSHSVFTLVLTQTRVCVNASYYERHVPILLLSR